MIISPEQRRNAAHLTALSILATVQQELGDPDRIERIVKVFGMVNVAPGFNPSNQPKVDAGTPRLPSDLAGSEGTYGQLSSELRTLDAYVGTTDLDRLRPSALTERLGALAADTETLYKLPELTRLRAGLQRLGLEPLVDELASRNLDVDGALGALEWVWLASIVEHVSINDPLVGTFDDEAQLRNIADYRNADKSHIESGPQRVLRAVAERITAVRDQYRSSHSWSPNRRH